MCISPARAQDCGNVHGIPDNARLFARPRAGPKRVQSGARAGPKRGQSGAKVRAGKARRARAHTSGTIERMADQTQSSSLPSQQCAGQGETAMSPGALPAEPRDEPRDEPPSPQPAQQALEHNSSLGSDEDHEYPGDGGGEEPGDDDDFDEDALEDLDDDDFDEDAGEDPDDDDDDFDEDSSDDDGGGFDDAHRRKRRRHSVDLFAHYKKQFHECIFARANKTEVDVFTSQCVMNADIVRNAGAPGWKEEARLYLMGAVKAYENIRAPTAIELTAAQFLHLLDRALKHE